jgi:polygalacturonase
MSLTRRSVIRGLSVVAASVSLPALAQQDEQDAAAIRDMIARGGDVRLPAGRFIVIHPLVVPSGSRITGAAQHKTELVKLIPTDTFYMHPILRLADASDVTIEGISLADPRPRQRDYAIHIKGTEPGRCRNIRIAGCRFRNVPVRVDEHSIDITFESNYVDGGGPHGANAGIALGGLVDDQRGTSGTSGGFVSRVRIKGNRFWRTRGEGVDLNWNIRDAEVSNNEFLDCALNEKDEALDIGGGACDNIVVSRNTIRFTHPNLTTYGIWIKLRSRRVLIEHNVIESASSQGVGIKISNNSDVTLRDNKISGFLVPIRRNP